MPVRVVSLAPASLGATIHGVSPLKDVWQFRNLQYASVPYRFANPESPPALAGDVDCTNFGPQCPQNHVDFRHLLRVPEDDLGLNSNHIHDEMGIHPEQDEFACLNLDITLPAPNTLSAAPKTRLPVFFWIHGGSQAVSFGDSASGLCDPSHLVARSVQMGRPFIAVTINYRLNIFAFGDGASGKNLALKDQKSAFEFVRAHIAGFGGDPDNVTIAGESAGAIYCHAHLAMGSIVPRQCILQSGLLPLSPPQPRSVAEELERKIADVVSALGGGDLRSAPVSVLLQAQEKLGLVSYFLQEEDTLSGWEFRLGVFERAMIGDTEYESVLWRNGIEGCSPETICKAFDAAGEASSSLKRQYGIVPSRPTSCKLGALDFLNDVRFALPTGRLFERCCQAGRPAFRFLIDQPNPWQSSSRAHHGVDLLYLFSGFDLSHNAAATRVAETMREKWIDFICGGNPWEPGTSFAFGPLGECRAIDDAGLAARRRQQHISLLVSVGLSHVERVVKILAPGRSGLLN